MPDIPLTVNQYPFYVADGAASAGGAYAYMIPVGMPDVADVAAVPMLKQGAVVGIVLSGAPAAGDTVTVQVFKNGVAIPGATAVISNAAGATSVIFSKDVPANQFAAQDMIGMRYTTTTATAYTVWDIFACAVVQYGLSE